MATNNKPVTAYLPDEIIEYLTQYCVSNGLQRKDKLGNTVPALGTAVTDILTIFFKGNVPDTIPSNTLEDLQMNLTIKVHEAIAEMKAESVSLRTLTPFLDRMEFVETKISSVSNDNTRLREAVNNLKQQIQSQPSEDMTGVVMGVVTKLETAIQEIYSRLEKLESQPSPDKTFIYEDDTPQEQKVISDSEVAALFAKVPKTQVSRWRRGLIKPSPSQQSKLDEVGIRLVGEDWVKTS